MSHADILWCRSHFALLEDGGRWGIPRSGIIFQRRGETLVLVAPDILSSDQLGEYEDVKQHFEAAGITVTR
jgi:hypothetical protein